MLTPPGLSRGRGRVSPTSDFSAQGGLPAGMTFTRASTATVECNWRGYVEEVAVDVPRFLYDRSLRYNEAANPWSDGSPPTGWAPGNAASIAVTFLQSGVRDGIFYSRWRVAGTSSGAGFPNLKVNPFADIGARVGDTISGQMFVEIVRVGAGNTADPGGMFVAMVGYTNVGAQQEISSTGGVGIGRTFADGPVRIQRTMNGAATECAVLRLTFPNSIGLVHDYDVEVGFPVINRGASYLTDTVPVSVLADRIGLVPQYGLLGALHDEVTTNVNTLARLEGAVAGSPGTPPTSIGTTTGSGNGLVRTISLGTEDGVPWVGYRYVGTTVAGQNLVIGLVPLAQIPAAPGETVTMSVFADVQGPAIPVAPLLYLAGYNAGVLDSGTAPLVAGASLGQCRTTGTLLLANGATTSFFSLITVVLGAGVVCDFTVRVGYPQPEKLPYATSVQLPPVGAPATAARAAELYSVSETLLDAAVSSLAVRYGWAPRRVVAGTGTGVVLVVGDGTNGPRSYPNAAFVPRLNLRNGGSDVIFSARPGGALGQGQYTTGVIAWGGGDGLTAWDGGPAVLDASAASPPSLAGGIRFGDESGGGTVSTSYVWKFLRLWKGQKLSPPQAQAASAQTV